MKVVLAEVARGRRSGGLSPASGVDFGRHFDSQNGTFLDVFKASAAECFLYGFLTVMLFDFRSV